MPVTKWAVKYVHFSPFVISCNALLFSYHSHYHNVSILTDFNRNRISMQSAETVEEGVEASKRGSNNSLFFLQQQQQQQQNSPRQQSPSQPHPPTPAARPHPLLQSYPSVSLPVQFHQSSFGSRHDSCQLKAGKPMTPPATSGIWWARATNHKAFTILLHTSFQTINKLNFFLILSHNIQ